MRVVGYSLRLDGANAPCKAAASLAAPLPEVGTVGSWVLYGLSVGLWMMDPRSVAASSTFRFHAFDSLKI